MLRLSVIPGDPRAVVCAPHGHDYNTEQVVIAVCGMTGLAGVVCHHIEDPATHHRVNVNRPTEGGGVEPYEEQATDEAVEAFMRYSEVVQAASGGEWPPALYVEVHGNETQLDAEVAHKGLGHAELMALRGSWTGPGGIRIEGEDEIQMRAAANKLFGMISMVPRSFHIELTAADRYGGADIDEAASSIAAMVQSLLR